MTAVYIPEATDEAMRDLCRVRALAFKWQRIMYVCWRDHVAYDETAYLISLKRRGSPLALKLELHLAKVA